MRRAITVIVLTAGLLASCAVQKTMVPTGGSRSDGTVELSYEYGMFEKPVIDPVAAINSAAQRCRAWGYSDAEAFGGQIQRCQGTDGYGNCARWLVTTQFQCIGANTPQ